MNFRNLILISLAISILFVGVVTANIPNSSTLKYMPFNSSVADYSHFEDTITNTNVTINNSVYKYGGGSAYFNGSSYLTFPQTNVDIPSGTWTLNCWIYPMADGFMSVFVGAGRDNGYAPISVGRPSPSEISILYTNSSVGWINQGSYIQPANLSSNAWHNIVVTRDSTAATLDVWVDGSHIHQWTGVPSTLLNTSMTRPPTIGAYYNAYYRNMFVGHIDDFVITNTKGIGPTVSDREYLTNPTASFTSDTTSGFAPLTIQFTNTSVGNAEVTTHAWYYTNSSSTGGNGTQILWSTDDSPSLTLGVGNWTVQKNIVNPFGISTSNQMWVNVSARPFVANFTASNTSGIQPLLVQFTDTSMTVDATIDSWAWDFGDGNTSTSQSPSHTYEVPGTHTANLTITNTSYSLVSTKLVTITVYKQPVCDFSSFNTVGTAPFTTRLFDTSTNLNTGPYTYYTDFGDGNTSTEEALYYNWNITGTYDVKHCITDSVTTACNNKTAYVTVGTATIAPVASFYGSPTTGNVPLTVSFTDVSSNTPTSWFWEFGDGTNSTLQNPTHQYTRSGFRTVNLTATNSAGSNITVRSKFVRVN